MYVSTCVVEGLRCFFIEPQNRFFAVDSVYGRRDDGMRFEFFCKVGSTRWPAACLSHRTSRLDTRPTTHTTGQDSITAHELTRAPYPD